MLTPLSSGQAEALVICLLGSFLWAAALLGAALLFQRLRRRQVGEKFWTGVLALAIAPSLIAPTFAAVGFSLRAPEPVEYVAETVSPPAVYVAAAPAPAASAKPQSPLKLEAVIGTASILYIYGVILALAVFIAKLCGLAFVIARAEPETDAVLKRDVDAWSRRLGLPSPPPLRRTRHAASVCVAGFVRPVVLIPEEARSCFARPDLVTMCAHELAHVKRGDGRLFTATAITRALFWFNPLVKMIAARVELAAEQAADALVIEAGADRRDYARCFVEGLKFSAEKIQGRPLAVLAFTPVDRGGRRDRLKAILTGERADAGRSIRLLTIMAALGAAGLAVAQAGLAVTPERPVLVDAREGKTMRAPFDGVVVEVRASGQNGVVRIRHDEKGATLIEGLKKIDIRVGDRVRRGDIVGVAGRNISVSIDRHDSASARDSFTRAPVDGEVSLGFGERNSGLLGKARPSHEGVDLAAKRGAPVIAPKAGVVVIATDRFKNADAWGKVVEIDHGHGLVTRYAHLGDYSVRAGDRVKAGQQIGTVGSSGVSTGPHVHFEVLKDGAPIDPTPVIAAWAPPAPPLPAVPATPSFDALAPVAPIAPPDAPSPPEAPAEIVEPTGFHFDFSGLEPELAESLESAMEPAIEAALAGADEGGYAYAWTDEGKGYAFLSEKDRNAMREAIREAQRAAKSQWKHFAAAASASAKSHLAHARAPFHQSIEEDDASEAEAERLERQAERESERLEREAEREAERLEREAERIERAAEQRARLEEARSELHATLSEMEVSREEATVAMEEARRDLEDAARDIENEHDMSRQELENARLALEEARRGLEQGLRDHERAMTEARERMIAKQAEIERRLKEFDQSN